MSDAATETIAFALGGLGGSNAHGVGFLEAARARRVTPRLISCTSGMIYWVCRYLQGVDLEAELRRHTESMRFPPTANWLNWADTMLYGVPGVCQTAVAEYWRRWMTPWNPLFADAWLDRIVPAQLLVPCRKQEAYAEIARVLSDVPHIGIIFNVFEPGLGVEYLHINDAARRIMGKEYGEADDGGVVYQPITAAAVEDALWLYLYGFAERKRIDGAYHRQIILRELNDAHIIYAARPQNQRWIGDLPTNMLRMRDLEIELWFNSSYAREVAGIELINELIAESQAGAEGKLTPRALARYHHIEVVPVEIGVNRGFFDYFVESMETYHEAYTRSVAAFERPRARPQPRQLAAPGAMLAAYPHGRGEPRPTAIPIHEIDDDLLSIPE